MINSLKLFIASKRWIKKFARNKLPANAYLNIYKGLKMFLRVADISGPSFNLAYGGKKSFDNYEKKDKDLLDRFFHDDMTFFDIGANIGHFSFYFYNKKKNIKCFLFEPYPELTKCLRLTVEHSDIENVSVHEIALSDANETCRFNIDTFNDGGHSLEDGKISTRSKAGMSFDVKCMRLDDFVKENAVLSIDIMKIDIQGAEYKFVNGAAETIKKFRPKMLIEVVKDDILSFWEYLEDKTETQFELMVAESLNIIPKTDIPKLIKQYELEHRYESNFLFIPKS